MRKFMRSYLGYKKTSPLITRYIKSKNIEKLVLFVNPSKSRT